MVSLNFNVIIKEVFSRTVDSNYNKSFAVVGANVIYFILNLIKERKKLIDSLVLAMKSSDLFQS